MQIHPKEAHNDHSPIQNDHWGTKIATEIYKTTTKGQKKHALVWNVPCFLHRYTSRDVPIKHWKWCKDDLYVRRDLWGGMCESTKDTAIILDVDTPFQWGASLLFEASKVREKTESGAENHHNPLPFTLYLKRKLSGLYNRGQVFRSNGACFSSSRALSTRQQRSFTLMYRLACPPVWFEASVYALYFKLTKSCCEAVKTLIECPSGD